MHTPTVALGCIHSASASTVSSVYIVEICMGFAVNHSTHNCHRWLLNCHIAEVDGMPMTGSHVDSGEKAYVGTYNPTATFCWLFIFTTGCSQYVIHTPSLLETVEGNRRRIEGNSRRICIEGPRGPYLLPFFITTQSTDTAIS